ncbi:Glycine/D-amino acid oxidase [Nocardioides scoriae]|uniref:Glycine/D-amino acid oxidase n=1 Tax=Nocardioides scoriae TaxID=642780 RepID=A0A1H1PY70_9ACTN|nr:FAD-dependent oxidoreductase [Nocardioides scoriae]SDS16100.1 Glycine/D-amino acid oxidase [Nocardioides scoriae]
MSASGSTPHHLAALRGAVGAPYWLQDAARPAPLPPLAGPDAADLVVVGGGYLGLWTALLAVEREPQRSVLVLEAENCGHAASGRNGGFCEASLTHGFGNGTARWPEEMSTLLELGRENLDGIEKTISEHGIDCDFRRTGSLAVATQPHQVEWAAGEHAAMQSMGMDVTWLEGDALRARIDSPTALAAFHDPDSAMLEPARLAWGLREACLSRGVRIHEGTRVTGLATSGAGVALATDAGPVAARQVVLATNAWPSLLRRLRLMTVPVYDYVLMTEPLTPAQRDAIGWAGREGYSDAGNQFIYARTTRDGRILWGGYDAIYHYGSAMGPAYEQRWATYETLSERFFTAFPQLAEVDGGVRFSHTWGGVIDTCTRFAAFYGTALKGRVGYAAGFTGLGVGATRFAGDVLLDLLGGLDTPRTRLEMVRTKPLPFPPEPLRWAGIEATRRSLARADANGGKENLWLRATGALGLGFDS